MQEIRNCVICGNEFNSVRKSHVCCSRICRDKYTKSKVKRTCAVCGKEFYSQRNTELCSDECKHQYRLNKGELRICQYCGKEFNALNGTHYFCTIKCKNAYYKDHPEYYELTCSQCGKIFKRNKKYQSQDGDVVFCCQKCKGEYYADYYRDDVLRRLKEGKYKTTMTSPHSIISEYLNEVNIHHENEYIIKPFSADIKLIDNNIIIEIMGSYWHADIRKYNKNKLNEPQQHNIERDTRKHQFLIDNNYRLGFNING